MSDVSTTDEWEKRLVERLRQNVERASGASKLAELVDELVRLRAENAALKAAVERVRALHGSKFGECDECHNEYPCPTLRALERTP